MMTIYYSHDYPDDTTMQIERRDDGNVELTLSFTSEDPDMGTEELVYAGNSGWYTLAGELLAELADYLNHVEFFRDGWKKMESDNYYGEFSRTALYAFEALLKDVCEERRA